MGAQVLLRFRRDAGALTANAILRVRFIFRNAGNHKHDAESDYERDVKMGEAALSPRN